MLRVWAAKCEGCEEWYAADTFNLIWTIGENVFRGMCVYCESELERKAKELDWSIDGRDG